MFTLAAVGLWNKTEHTVQIKDSYKFFVILPNREVDSFSPHP